MKSKFKKSRCFMALVCRCLALMLGIMLAGHSFAALAAESEEAFAPTIVSVAGIAIGGSNMGGFPSAIVGEDYKDSNGKNYKIVATGSGTLTYSAREYETEGYGRMPEGLHLDSKTGEFYGTITSAGSFGVSITVSNEYGSANVMCWISVYEESEKPAITTESLPNGAVGSTYSQAISYSGVYASSVYPKIVKGALPAGLTFGMQYFSPTVYGTPTEKGTFTFTVSINNGAGIATKEYTIEITDEAVRPYLIPSATIVNESDKYSSIEAGSSLNIHVVKGKEVSVQLVSSGTNTADNPTIYELFGKDGVLPKGLTMSDGGLITGIPSRDIETTGGKKQINTYISVGNKTVSGQPQSSGTFIYIVVHDDGYVDWINLDPKTTSVAKGGTRQFEIEWKAYGDVDCGDVTWYFNTSPSSASTTLSDTGLLTVGIDETGKYLYVRAKHRASGRLSEAIVTVVDHAHTTELVEKVDKTCEADGAIQHYRCTICGELFEDALATKTISADKVKISASHDYGEMVPQQNATCVATGKQAYYECSACHKLFSASKEETTEADLVIAIDKTAHKFGSWKSEAPANCATAGTKAHKDCAYCHKHFDEDGTEMTDLAIPKTDEHLVQTTYSKDRSGHWHVCTRAGCKDGGKVDYAEHTPSAAEATKTTDVHCTVCGFVMQEVVGHIHDLELVAGTAKGCYTDGSKSYYVCAKGDHPCGKYFADKDGYTEITENMESWKVIPAGHAFGEWIAEVPATTASDGVKAHQDCTVCEKHFDMDGHEITDLTIAKLTAPAEPTNPTAPSEPTAPGEEKKDGLPGGAIAGIAIGSVLVAGLGGFALVWFVIKKKKWADLVVIFKKLFAKKGM